DALLPLGRAALTPDRPRPLRAPHCVRDHATARRARILRPRRRGELRFGPSCYVRGAHGGRREEGRGGPGLSPRRHRGAVRLAVLGARAGTTRRAARPAAAATHERGLLRVTYAYCSFEDMG